MMIDIERLNELHAKTTPGEWSNCMDGQSRYSEICATSNDGPCPIGFGLNARNDGDFTAELHNAWPEIAAELQELERWRIIFGCEDPQDAVYTTCEKPAARVLEERQAEIRRLEAEQERLRQLYISESFERSKYETALNATEERASDLLRENQRLREFEAEVRDIEEYGDLDRWPGEIDIALNDLDRKRGEHEPETD